MSDKSRFIVRAVMTEYMILMAGALVLYLTLEAWPHATGWIAGVGGILVATGCVANFFYVLRTSRLISREAPTRPPEP